MEYYLIDVSNNDKKLRANETILNYLVGDNVLIDDGEYIVIRRFHSNQYGILVFVVHLAQK